MQAPDILPGHTLYVHNLNEKVRLDELKKSLYHVFSHHGNILEIVAHKTYKLRGQAWIVFEDLGASTKAHREMQNFMFYGKPMHVTFSKDKSDVIAKLDGSFKPRPKRKLGPDLIKPHEADKAKKDSRQKTERPPREGGAVPMDIERSHQTLVAREPPNSILFVQNLPEDATDVMLETLFRQYPGYKESRLVAGKKGIAFVEFENEYMSGTAMEGLQAFKITPTHLMQISYAKK